MEVKLLITDFASLNQKIVKTKDYQYEKSLITLIQIRSL